jgi:hypothetical protein
LQPAARLNAALGANDRLKYLLQMASARAKHPEQSAAAPMLKRERMGCRLSIVDRGEPVP